jgi:hypothetical protein
MQPSHQRIFNMLTFAGGFALVTALICLSLFPESWGTVGWIAVVIAGGVGASIAENR